MSKRVRRESVRALLVFEARPLRTESLIPRHNEERTWSLCRTVQAGQFVETDCGANRLRGGVSMAQLWLSAFAPA
jgi:hypothetical protein